MNVHELVTTNAPWGPLGVDADNLRSFPAYCQLNQAQFLIYFPTACLYTWEYFMQIFVNILVSAKRKVNPDVILYYS